MGFLDTLKAGFTGTPTTAPTTTSPYSSYSSGPSNWGPVGATAVTAPLPQWQVGSAEQLGAAEPDRSGGVPPVMGSPMGSLPALSYPWGSEPVTRRETRPGGGGYPYSADPAAEPVPAAARPVVEQSTASKIAEALGAAAQGFMGRFNGQAVPERAGPAVLPEESLWHSAKPWIAAAAVVVGAVMLFRASK